ncbi:MAG: hypothetical protein AB7O96_19515 [Pseudobdellovibrionaceae bacterium]
MVHVLRVFLFLAVGGFVSGFIDDAHSACEKEMGRLESSLVYQKTIMLQLASANGTAGATLESFHEAFEVKVGAGIKIKKQMLSPMADSAKAFYKAGEKQKALVEKVATLQKTLVSDLKKCLDKGRDSVQLSQF